MYEKWKKKSRKEIGGVAMEDNDVATRPNPNYRVNTKVKNELRNVVEIKKLQKSRENNKFKNMKKDKRTQFENMNRKKKKEANKSQNYSTTARNRRSKVIVKC
jgi:hypothetical protein